MRLPGFLDRERRLLTATIVAGQRRKDLEMWFRLYQRSLARCAEMTADVQASGRYRLAWASARRRAAGLRAHNDLLQGNLSAAAGRVESLRRALDLRRLDVATARRTWQAERDSLVAERNAAQIELSARLIPPPAVPAASRDRDNANRLAAENAELRAERDALKRKLEGVPS